MVNSRDIADLDPIPRQICQLMLENCAAEGIELLITSTYRDIEAQDALYAIGRTVNPERKKVTNAKGGRSWHNFRAAFDVVPIVGGKPVWNARDPIWKRVVEIGKAAGAEAGAEWKTFPDLPHFQVRPFIGEAFIAFDEALARFQVNGTIFT